MSTENEFNSAMMHGNYRLADEIAKRWFQEIVWHHMDAHSQGAHILFAGVKAPAKSSPKIGEMLTA